MKRSPILLLGILACGHDAPTSPPTPLAAMQAASSAEIHMLINQLVAPPDKGVMFATLAQIQNQVARGVDAQASIADFVTRLEEARDADRLLDPNGSEPPTIAEALHDLVNAVARFAGLPPAVHGILAVGNLHSCLIQTDGQTVCWGADFGGQVGDGPPASGTPLTRVPVAGDPSFDSVVTNGSYTCGFTEAGAALCWGRNPSAIAGPHFTSPTPLSFGPFLSISPARLTACALTLSNTAVCWGRNQEGELGDGTQVPRPTPVPVTTSLLFASIEASWIHTCALTSAGAAHCWGRWQGQLLPRDLTPVSVPGGHVFARLYTGGTHTCGLTLNDETWCWGDNASGQLGDGTTVGGGTPVQVSGGHFFAMVAIGTTPNSGGRSHTCGLLTTGRILCWGLNDQGQLGDGSTTDHVVPAPILSNELFVAVDAGDRSTCAMTPDRRVFCWGTNAFGELGTGAAGGFSTTPVLVP
jgi:regulator of chromosome condensation (RCC1) repeat-containing protein/Regulator of Chromosome Condensation (RCC1) repeat protein